MNGLRYIPFKLYVNWSSVVQKVVTVTESLKSYVSFEGKCYVVKKQDYFNNFTINTS